MTGSSFGPLLGELRQELGEALVAAGVSAELTIEVRRDDVALAAAALSTRFRYTLLADLCGADYPRRQPRFEVIYHLYSFRENRRLRVRVLTDASSPVPSVAAVWRGADWLEREAHDLFGIGFSGRPALLPLLLWDGFAGYPLRKDFPLGGCATGTASPALLAPPSAAAPPGDTRA
jgi:NADH-quinone oxidoreductase subunit C